MFKKDNIDEQTVNQDIKDVNAAGENGGDAAENTASTDSMADGADNSSDNQQSGSNDDQGDQKSGGNSKAESDKNLNCKGKFLSGFHKILRSFFWFQWFLAKLLTLYHLALQNARFILKTFKKYFLFNKKQEK